MPEEIEIAIAELLKEKGYKNVEHNCGSIWYEDDEGNEYCIGEIKCE